MIHITFTTDNNFVRHCAVAMVSIFENNKGTDFTIHILGDNLSDEMKQSLTELCAQYKQHILFYTMRSELLDGFTMGAFSKRMTKNTYYRCFLGDIIPDTVDKILYLDCDIVVAGDLRPFWETPLDGVGVAAVEDIGSREPERYEGLQYPMQYSYFNAGVLLINLDFWRKNDMGRMCTDFFKAHPERIRFNDQDLLNCVLYDKKVMVDLKWNAQDGFYRNPGSLTDEWRARFADTLLHPVIIHYANRKPWSYECQHPLRRLYFDYLQRTPWKDCRPDLGVGNRIKRFFRLLPFYVGLRKPKYVKLEDIG